MRPMLVLVMTALALSTQTSCRDTRYTQHDLPPRVLCTVSAYADDTFADRRKVLIRPVDGFDHDLAFREFRVQAARAMQDAGYVVVESMEDAQLVAFVEYGIGAPRVLQYTFSEPVFHYIAGRTTTAVAGSADGSAAAVAGAQVVEPGRLAYAGQRTTTETRVDYRRFARIEAICVKEYRDGSQVIPAWKIEIGSTGASGDLRAIFPHLLTAAQPFLGADTGTSLPTSVPMDHEYSYYIKTGKASQASDLKLLSGGFSMVLIHDGGALTATMRRHLEDLVVNDGLFIIADVSKVRSPSRTLRLDIECSEERGRISISAVDLSDERVLGIGISGVDQEDPRRGIVAAWKRIFRDNMDRIGYKEKVK